MQDTTENEETPRTGALVFDPKPDKPGFLRAAENFWNHSQKQAQKVPALEAKNETLRKEIAGSTQRITELEEENDTLVGANEDAIGTIGRLETQKKTLEDFKETREKTIAKMQTTIAEFRVEVRHHKHLADVEQHNRHLVIGMREANAKAASHKRNFDTLELDEAALFNSFCAALGDHQKRRKERSFAIEVAPQSLDTTAEDAVVYRRVRVIPPVADQEEEEALDLDSEPEDRNVHARKPLALSDDSTDSDSETESDDEDEELIEESEMDTK